MRGRYGTGVCAGRRSLRLETAIWEGLAFPGGWTGNKRGIINGVLQMQIQKHRQYWAPQDRQIQTERTHHR